MTKEELLKGGWIETQPGQYARAPRVHVVRDISLTEPQRPVLDEPVGKAAGEEKSPGRFRLLIESRRRRLIDPDNLCPKYLIDCLRYAEIIPDDTAAHVEISVTQKKVGNKSEEGTMINVWEV